MDPITVAAVGMQSDLQRLTTISQNLANVTTPGYKKQLMVTRAFDAVVGDMLAAQAGSGAPLTNQELAMDMTAGTLRRTGNPLDIAIDGEGFFEIRTEQGLAYTRQGELHVDPRGRLVTAKGFPVMGLVGDILTNGNQPLTINDKGEVTQAGNLLGQLKLVRFDNPQAMTSLGNGLFAQAGAQFGDQGTVGTIRSGYQENSNVMSAHEMVQLTETLRHFESMQKLIQGYDELYEKAMRKLGDF